MRASLCDAACRADVALDDSFRGSERGHLVSITRVRADCNGVFDTFLSPKIMVGNGA